jgi:hypothetical protein
VYRAAEPGGGGAAEILESEKGKVADSACASKVMLMSTLH